MLDSSHNSNSHVDVDVRPMLFLRYFEAMGEDSIVALGGNSENTYLLDESSVMMMAIW